MGKLWREEWRRKLDYMKIAAIIRQDYSRAQKYISAILALEEMAFRT